MNHMMLVPDHMLSSILPTTQPTYAPTRPSFDLSFPWHTLCSIEESADENGRDDISTMFERVGVTHSPTKAHSRKVGSPARGVQRHGIAIGKERRQRPATAPLKLRRNFSESERRREVASARYACSTWEEILSYVAEKEVKQRQVSDWEDDCCALARVAL